MIRTPRIYSLNDAPIRHLARLGDVVLFVTSLVLIPIRGPLIQNHVVPDEGNGSLQLPTFWNLILRFVIKKLWPSLHHSLEPAVKNSAVFLFR